MKVGLFCDGSIRDDKPPAGMVLPRATDAPKPMQRIGRMPLLRHTTQWYSYFGHTDFVICLGYRVGPKSCATG